MMRIVLVVAASENDAIGKGNSLPWRLPDDLRRFKSLTLGKPIIMGRKTHESIGKPLPGRKNIVISRRRDLDLPGCVVCDSIDTALATAAGAEEVCVIGGAEIYRLALSRADVVQLTRVHARVDGDVFLPALDPQEWQETFREEHAADAQHMYAFTFLTLARRRRARR